MAYSETKWVESNRWPLREAAYGAAALALLACGAIAYQAHQTPVQLASAHVLVATDAGYGSATHIGGGYYITAAHVVANNPEVAIGGQNAVVLWANHKYDVALLAGPIDAETVPMTCYEPRLGDAAVAHGNPVMLEGIRTQVVVAGAPREVGDWKVAIPVDGAIAPGMSGGGIVMAGQLVGIVVGAISAPHGGYFGVNLIVPSSVICVLMGRV